MNFKRSWTAVLISGAVWSSLLAPAAEAADKPIQVFLNGEAVSFPTEPVIINGITMVPFRTILERLNMQVSWNEAARTVLAANGSHTIELEIGSLRAKVNGEEKRLAEAPVIHNGSTLIPLRFVSESLQAEVKWDDAERSVRITAATDPLSLATRSEPTQSQSGETFRTLSKAQRSSYSAELLVERIAVKPDTGYFGQEIPKPVLSHMSIGSDGQLYVLSDKNNKYFANGTNIDILKVNLDAKVLSTASWANSNYIYHYNNSNGKSTEGSAGQFYPQLMTIKPGTNETAVAGYMLGQTDTLFGIHERLTEWSLSGYQAASSSRSRAADFLRYSDSGELFVSDLSAGRIYSVTGDQTLRTAFFMDSQAEWEWSGKKVEAVINNHAVYLFDSGSGSLYRLDRKALKLELVYRFNEEDIDAVTVHIGNFYFAAGGSIYELNPKGELTEIISKLPVPLERSADFRSVVQAHLSLFAFDSQDNIIFISNANSVYRIKR